MCRSRRTIYEIEEKEDEGNSDSDYVGIVNESSLKKNLVCSVIKDWHEHGLINSKRAQVHMLT